MSAVIILNKINMYSPIYSHKFKLNINKTSSYTTDCCDKDMLNKKNFMSDYTRRHKLVLNKKELYTGYSYKYLLNKTAPACSIHINNQVYDQYVQ